jgi:ornithine cyclodeaminase
MQFMSEDQSARLITHEMAYAAACDALKAAVSQGAMVFPAVIAHGSDAQNRFTVKSGATGDLAGLKVGSFWPGNPARGLARHNSVTLLFDQDVGRIEWVVESGKVNAYRTAAADAVATDCLARDDAATLAIFGAGIRRCTNAWRWRASVASRKCGWWHATRPKARPSYRIWPPMA